MGAIKIKDGLFIGDEFSAQVCIVLLCLMFTYGWGFFR